MALVHAGWGGPQPLSPAHPTGNGFKEAKATLKTSKNVGN